MIGDSCSWRFTRDSGDTSKRRTDGRTNGQRENVMTPPVSLSWWTYIKRTKTAVNRGCTISHIWERSSSPFFTLIVCLKHRHTTAWVWCNYVVKHDKICTQYRVDKNDSFQKFVICICFRRSSCSVFAAPPLWLNTHWLPTSVRLSSVCCPSVSVLCYQQSAIVVTRILRRGTAFMFTKAGGNHRNLYINIINWH